MTYIGHVQNKVIVLDGDVRLPEGAEVRVEPVLPIDQTAARCSLLEVLGDLVGSVPDLPEDLAENHDHYIHGTPKR